MVIFERADQKGTPTIAIVGAGALGSVFAAALVQAGSDTTLLGRRATPDITVCEPPCHIAGTALQVVVDPAAVSGADFVLIMVKAYDTEAAADGIAPFLQPATCVVSLQNGLGNIARLRAHLPSSQRILAGVTSQAARRVSPGLVMHTGTGPTILGYRDDEDRAAAERLAAALRGAGLPAGTTGDIDHFVWRKVAVNAAINGLTAIAGVPNGALLQERHLRAASEALADEAAMVAAAHGYSLDGIVKILHETISATAENRSSMLQDVQLGRRTEVDAIYGSLIEAGAAKGISLPGLTVVDALVRQVSAPTSGRKEPA